MRVEALDLDKLLLGRHKVIGGQTFESSTVSDAQAQWVRWELFKKECPDAPTFFDVSFAAGGSPLNQADLGEVLPIAVIAFISLASI
jgi:hypothetical protein